MMKHRFIIPTIFTVILCSAASLYPQQKKMTSFRIEKPTPALERILRESKTDITGGKRGEYIVIYDTEEFAAQLTKMGYAVSRLVPDEPLPEELTDYGEMKELLVSLADDYPAIMKVDSLGASVNGLGIWAVKISDDVNVLEDEQKFLVVGSYHGDEVLNVEVALFEITWLIENYAVNPGIAELVNTFELWFIPMVNPDGRMSDPPQRRNMNEVDLNRNHSFMFTPGGQGGHGPAPHSEPETQAIKKLVESVHFDGTISYHSFGDLVLHPWGFVDDLPTPDEDLYFNLGNELAAAMEYGYSHPFRYTVEGEYSDYMYSEFGTISFTMETYIEKVPGDPLFAMEKVKADNIIGFELFLRRMMGPGITGLVTDNIMGKPAQAVVSVIGKEDDTLMKPRGTEPVFGRYSRLLEPGTYTVVFSGIGFIPKEYEVTIQAGEPLQTINVILQTTGFPVIVAQELLDGISGIGFGNGNALLNRGETVEVSLSLRNAGGLTAEDVYVKLSTTDTSITIETDSASFGTIPPGATRTADQNFVLSVAFDALPGHVAELTAALYDKSGLITETVLSDTLQGFYDDVESDSDSGWLHSHIPGTINSNDDWERSRVFGRTPDPPGAHSGEFAWGNDLGQIGYNGLYQDYVHNYLQMRSLNCSGWDAVFLQFFRWLTKDASDSAYITVNGQVVWESPPGTAFFDDSWTLQTLDISEIAANDPEVVIRFGLKTDASRVAGGWTLDDFLVFDEPLLTENSTGLIPLPPPVSFILHQNFPNPFNLGTTIPFELKETGQVNISIYNVLGQKVRTLVNRYYDDAGFYYVNWYGLDDFGRFVASGMYFYRLEIGGFTQAKKMLIIR